MPLENGKSEAAFKHNLKAEINAGKPQKQALAIAYAKQREGKDNESNRHIDANGFIEIRDNPISKVGVFPYSGKSIGAPDPDRIYKVYRPEEELSNAETIESFKLLPWTDDHPDKLLGPEEEGKRPVDQKGTRGITGEQVYFKDGVLYANIKILSEYLKKLIDSGKKELSAGYQCVWDFTSGIWNGIQYDAIQRNIRGNHLALVDQGRMGPDVAVLDHLTFTFDAKELFMADEAKKEEIEEKEMSLDDVMNWMKENGPKMRKMQDMVDKHFGAKDEEKDVEKEPAIKDEKEEEKEEKKEEAKDNEEEKEEKKDSMDAAELKAVRAELDELKKSVHKTTLQEISQRDALASELSRHIGTFDHADKTLDEVSEYGIKKLGIKCPKGSEAVALSAFLQGKKTTSAKAMDSANKRSSAIDAYING
ncbi:MAG: DUF2213 domain-containing protein [Patescibacteria group bacterium]|nr:DUF2213 domain-containing protein [Patescibacteria group bacterium]